MYILYTMCWSHYTILTIKMLSRKRKPQKNNHAVQVEYSGCPASGFQSFYSWYYIPIEFGEILLAH